MSGRGGARHGAGHKPTGERKARLTVSLHPHELAEVERIFADALGQSPSQAIHALLRGEWQPVRK